MATPTDFEQLFALVGKGSRGRETDALFVVDHERSRPFAPMLALNPALFPEMGEACQIAGPLLAEMYEDEVGAERRRIRPNGTIIAEGDSWVNLPNVFYPDTMIDFLAEEYPINNIGKWGDTAAAMIVRGEYVPYLKTKKVKVLIFSGGGVDIFTRLSELLPEYRSDKSSPNDVGYYVGVNFDEAFFFVKEAYRALAATVKYYSSSTKIIVHGYDYSIPWADGQFLGRRMEAKKHRPLRNPLLCRAIIRELIDRFAKELTKVSSEFPSVHHVSLLNGVKKHREWFDEIHPKEVAARRNAKTLGTALTRLLKDFSPLDEKVARKPENTKKRASAA